MVSATDTVAHAETEAGSAGRTSTRFFGVLIASVGPALFWAGALAGVSALAGIEVSTGILATLGVAIAVFLSIIVAPMILRSTGADG